MVEVAPVPAAAVAEMIRPDAAPVEAAHSVEEPPAAALALPSDTSRVLSARAGGDIALRLPSTADVRIEAPSPPAPEMPRDPIAVGGAVAPPRKIHHVAPAYPAVARASRQEGTVVLEATIARDGSVIAARILQSNPLFDRAAVEAVRQWRYTTPTLNGVPIDVLMTVTVRFALR